MIRFDQQWHGYRRGHQLLASTTELAPRDQDLVDKLSDASGSPRPGELFDAYLTVYPLPSGRFNVVARTWQDLEASRSGTVFTRSLLIPADTWRSLESIRPLFDELRSRDVTDAVAEISQGGETWPHVSDPALAPLIEAMFLERAASIAAFGFKRTEVIGGRLLEALWPSRRATFAMCTHSMGPRSLIDRDFDLVFAPESARSRFAKWDGRKVSSSAANTDARHDWTDQIRKRVFDDARPSLEDLDEIGVFEGNSGSDGSSLRLALRWSELKQKAATTPTSLLGMLDILGSLGRAPSSVPALRSLIIESVAGAAMKPSPETWQFLQLLVRKLGNDIPLSVLRAIFSATESVAHAIPAAVLGNEQATPSTPMPHLLRPAVAKGLAHTEYSTLPTLLRGIEPTLGVSLMAESPRFATAVTASLASQSEAELAARLADTAADDRRAARRLGIGVSRGSLGSAVAPLLKVVLANASAGNFDLLSRNVMAARGEEKRALFRTLIEAARSPTQRNSLRKIAVTAPFPHEGDQLLLGLVNDREAATWLIETLSNQHYRLQALLLTLMANWSDNDLREIAREGQNRDALLEATLSGLPSSGEAFIRLLRLGSISSTTSVTLMRHAGSRLSAADRKEATIAVLDRLLSLDPGSYGELFEPMLSWIDPAKLLNASTSTVLSGEQVGRNINAISQSKSVGRFVPFVDLLTRRLVERRTGGYGAGGYDGWAHLLRLARLSSPESLVRSADGALDYALARRSEPAGAVVAASFPVVYARLRKESPPDLPFNLITAVLMLPIVLFTDWDKSKAARHGLVDAFLRSNWEPVELLRAAVDADIPGKVLGYLASESGGRDYIRRAAAGIKGLPETTHRRLAAALDDFRASGS